MQNKLHQSYKTISDLLNAFIADQGEIDKTAEASRLIAETFQKGGKGLSAGNGGSLCDALHFAEEFTGRFQKDRSPLPVIALADPTHLTCVGNDYGFDHIFSRGVEAFGQPGDFFLGLSTSGNSENIIKAVRKAREKGLKVILMLGKDGGKLAGQADIEFIIPGQTSDRIQEIHMIILHIIIEGVERILFPQNYS
jgi:D-sedoheptulose 7-phosphate isomerase